MRGQLSLHALAWLGAALANAAAAQPTVPASVATPARGRAASAELVVRIDGVPVYAQPFDVAQLKREIDKESSKRERGVAAVDDFSRNFTSATLIRVLAIDEPAVDVGGAVFFQHEGLKGDGLGVNLRA